MLNYIIACALGVIFIIIGRSNMKGNISSLHSYHRHRVKEEDKVPFGRKVGQGMIIIGITIMLASIIQILGFYFLKQVVDVVSNVLLVIGLGVGSIISFYAIIKYNKGLF